MDEKVKQAQALIKERDEIEARLKELDAVLKSENIGMHEPLVDEQDYPRADVDVYLVRNTRHDIACLRTDHKSITQRIEALLYEIHGAAKQEMAIK